VSSDKASPPTHCAILVSRNRGSPDCFASNNLFTDIIFHKSSKRFRVPPNYLSKGYVEFETGVVVSAPLTANIRFFDADFVVSIIVFEDDFEDSNDSLLAPPVTREPPNKYFNNYYPNYNNT
jgi:hypothetical protein